MSNPAPRLAAVTTEPGFVLVASWQDGTTGRIALSGWIKSGPPAIQRLRDPVLFGRAAVADYGLAVEWDDDKDLAIDTVHLELLVEQQAPFSADDLVAWQDRHKLSNQEAADLIGVHVNTWANYRNGVTSMPRGVAIALRAMDRDPLLFAAHFRPRYPGRPPSVAE